MKKNQNTELKTIKQLSELYDIKPASLYHLSSRKKYSFNQIKQHVFNIKYGKGDDYDNFGDRRSKEWEKFLFRIPI